MFLLSLSAIPSFLEDKNMFPSRLPFACILALLLLPAIHAADSSGTISIKNSGVTLTDAGKTAADKTEIVAIPAGTETAGQPAAPVTTESAKVEIGAIQAAAAPAEPEKPAIDSRRFLFASRPVDFTEPNYAVSIGRLVSAFEEKAQHPVKPGEKGKVALKIYTSSGPGIATPRSLTRAVIKELEKRGFTRDNIYLVDLTEKRIREAGYLPRLKTANENFEGCPVLALDSGKYYNPKWFYENPLPSTEVVMRVDDLNAPITMNDKHSYLPVPLLFEVDFWINLPVAMDSPALGVSAALGNATIWNISNQRRFLDNPGNAQKAAVEIAAIPEFKNKLLFNIVTLERYQYIGGPRFDANYCISENRLWLSANPLILDYLLMQRMNNARAKHGFPLIAPEPTMFIMGNTPPISLGSCVPSQIELMIVDPSQKKSSTVETAEEEVAVKP